MAPNAPGAKLTAATTAEGQEPAGIREAERMLAAAGDLHHEGRAWAGQRHPGRLPRGAGPRRVPQLPGHPRPEGEDRPVRGEHRRVVPERRNIAAPKPARKAGIDGQVTKTGKERLCPVLRWCGLLFGWRVPTTRHPTGHVPLELPASQHGRWEAARTRGSGLLGALAVVVPAPDVRVTSDACHREVTLAGGDIGSLAGEGPPRVWQQPARALRAGAAEHQAPGKNITVRGQGHAVAVPAVDLRQTGAAQRADADWPDQLGGARRQGHAAGARVPKGPDLAAAVQQQHVVVAARDGDDPGGCTRQAGVRAQRRCARGLKLRSSRPDAIPLATESAS